MQRRNETVVAGVPGSPLVARDGALVEVRLKGTLTKATIYSDNGITQMSNPITTDTMGRYGYYVADGHYDEYITHPDINPLLIPDVLLEDPEDNAPNVGTTLLYPGATLSLTDSHHNSIIKFQGACVVTVTAGLRPDFVCVIEQYGTGQVTVVSDGTTQIHNVDNLFGTEGQYVQLGLSQGTTDDYTLSGRTA